jgi:asparagine synthase (glutamine-hydrolysing)
MCGIVGSVRHGACLDERVSLSMRDSLQHRGPDDAGLWQSPPNGVTLGSRRLAILDLSPRGHQPMQDASRTLTVVFNGEIYNCVELRRELQQFYPFRSQTDTEVLLAAYSYWGPDFVQRLNGMFAFAIWDSSQKTLFAARDRFGEKPFYYYRRSKLFLFASEIKAILASGMVAAEANHPAIFRFLAYRQTDESEDTFFKDILALPPAHTLLYSPEEDTLIIRRYWDLDPAAETRYPSERQYSEHLLELLQQSVKLRLRSDVPVGSCLSGGLDSSSIVGLMAAEADGGRQSTFSARFKERAIDEGEYIQPVAQRFAIKNYTVFPDPLRLIEDVGNLAWHQEHPFVGPSIYAQWCVMRLAADQGVTVLLDGQGADESLAGYLSSRHYHYRDLFGQLRWGALAKALWSHAVHGDPANLVNMFIPQVTRPNGMLPVSWEPLAMTDDFVGLAAVPATQAPAKFKSALHSELYQQLRCSMLPKLLRFADRSSMAFSREVRLPYLDHRLVEYLFAIPETHKIRGTTTKYILRQAMQGKLPAKVLNRTDKKGFETPQGAWLRGPLRTWVEEILRSTSFRERGWIDQGAALKVWKRFLVSPHRNQNVIFRWISLEQWARTFLRAPGAFQVRPKPQLQLTTAISSPLKARPQLSEL